MNGFTDSGWFIVAALIVMFTIGAVSSMVSYAWGKSDAIKQVQREDESEIRGMRRGFNAAGKHAEKPVEAIEEKPQVICPRGRLCLVNECKLDHPRGIQRD